MWSVMVSCTIVDQLCFVVYITAPVICHGAAKKEQRQQAWIKGQLTPNPNLCDHRFLSIKRNRWKSEVKILMGRQSNRPIITVRVTCCNWCHLARSHDRFKIIMIGRKSLRRQHTVIQGPQRVWKVWKKYGICFFNFQTWKKYGNLWKALETSKKVWNFLPSTRENLEDRKCTSRSSARKLLPRVWPKAARGLNRLFAFVPFNRTNCVGQAKSCLPAASNKKARSKQFVCQEKIVRKSGGGSWFLDWRCSWMKSLRRSRSFAARFWLYRLHGVTSAKMWLLFVRSNFRCLSETAWKARQALVSLAFFSFLSFRWRKRRGGSRSVPLAILVRSAAQTDPPRLLVRDRCVSDITCKALPETFDLAGASRSRRGSELGQDGMGSFEVEESLSIGNASNGFVDHAKRIFHRCWAFWAQSSSWEMWDSLESNISYLARTLCLSFFVFFFSPLPKRLTLKAAWLCWVNQARFRKVC